MLESSLLKIATRADQKRKGYLARLEQLWNSAHKTLPSTGRALAQKLIKLRQRSGPDQTPAEVDQPLEVPDPDPSHLNSGNQKWSQVLGLKLLRVIKAEVSRGPQSLEQRESQPLRGAIAQVGQSVLEEMWDIMVDIWRSSRMKGLWDLNCLFYGGAKVVTEMATNVGGSLLSQVESCVAQEVVTVLEQNQGDEPLLDPELDPWTGLSMPTLEQDTPQQAVSVSQTLKANLSKERATIAQVRKGIGHLKAELRRIHVRAPRGPP